MRLAGRLILDGSSIPQSGWVEVAGDRIARVEPGSCPATPDLGGDDCFICPAFIDAHVHLPQVDSIGVDGLELLEWLAQAIYPAESKWAEPRHAEQAAARAYRRMLRAGTLGYAGYLSSHLAGVTAVIRAAHAMPLRAVVGQSLMDREAPDLLLGQPEARLVRSARGRLVTSLNPRFAVSCSEAMLRRTGERLAAGFPDSPKQREPEDPSGNLFLQTHLAETKAECARVRELFPEDPHYTGVYDRFGLLTPRTLLAHGIHLSDEEWSLIASRGSVVVHCPGANTFLESGLFNLRAAREHGVRVALGSDVAAGPDFAMPRVARAMIEAAKLRRMTIDAEALVPTPGEAFDLITRGNADSLGWRDMGRIEVGASADLLVLRSTIEPDRHFFGRLIHGWEETWIVDRLVAGRPMVA